MLSIFIFYILQLEILSSLSRRGLATRMARAPWRKRMSRRSPKRIFLDKPKSSTRPKWLEMEALFQLILNFVSIKLNFEHKSKQGKTLQFLRHTIEGSMLLWIVRQQGLFGQSVLFEAHLYSHPYSNQWWNLRCGVCDCGLIEYKTPDKMGSRCRDRNLECWGYVWI